MKTVNTPCPEECSDCCALTYPPQGFCRRCLSENMTPVNLPASGNIMAVTQIQHSFEDEIKPILPLTVASVDMGTGCVVFTLATDDSIQAGAAVSVDRRIWPFGNLLTAVKEQP